MDITDDVDNHFNRNKKFNDIKCTLTHKVHKNENKVFNDLKIFMYLTSH